jgi:hypothetical protein
MGNAIATALYWLFICSSNTNSTAFTEFLFCSVCWKFTQLFPSSINCSNDSKILLTQHSTSFCFQDMFQLMPIFISNRPSFMSQFLYLHDMYFLPVWFAMPQHQWTKSALPYTQFTSCQGWYKYPVFTQVFFFNSSSHVDTSFLPDPYTIISVIIHVSLAEQI